MNFPDSLIVLCLDQLPSFCQVFDNDIVVVSECNHLDVCLHFHVVVLCECDRRQCSYSLLHDFLDVDTELLHFRDRIGDVVVGAQEVLPHLFIDLKVHGVISCREHFEVPIYILKI